MLTVHHLRRSQSERIVWLCEELGLAYELKCYDRNKTDVLAPPEYKALHPMGTAPVITDGDLVLGESGAIVEYILAKHGPAADARAGRSRLRALPLLVALRQRHAAAHHGPQHDAAPARRAGGPADAGSVRARLALVLSQVEARCARRRIWRARIQRGRHHERVLAHHDAQLFPGRPRALSGDPRLPAAAIGVRRAYRRAMHKGDPEMAPMLG